MMQMTMLMILMLTLVTALPNPLHSVYPHHPDPVPSSSAVRPPSLPVSLSALHPHPGHQPTDDVTRINAIHDLVGDNNLLCVVGISLKIYKSG